MPQTVDLFQRELVPSRGLTRWQARVKRTLWQTAGVAKYTKGIAWLGP